MNSLNRRSACNPLAWIGLQAQRAFITIIHKKSDNVNDALARLPSDVFFLELLPCETSARTDGDRDMGYAAEGVLNERFGAIPLKDAKRNLKTSPSYWKPYFWAPFVLIGSGR